MSALLLGWTLALVSLLVGTAAIFMALVPAFPVSWLYHHARVRKPVAWSLLAANAGLLAWAGTHAGRLPAAWVAPLVVTAFGVVLTYRMHQESAFAAIDFPPMADTPLELPLRDDQQLAVLEVEGVTRAYPLDFVIHHHIVNDRFGDRLIALTYCAMCRSILPFDVTELGPLFVGSFKHANMIVADRRTRTFFQQATFESLIGPLHPRTLAMVPFQLFSWAEVKRMLPQVQVARVTEHDLREFQLPVPGIWRRITASDATPGLSARERDRTLPARTHVIGLFPSSGAPAVAFVKTEVLRRGVVRDEAHDVVLVASGAAVNAFRAQVQGARVELSVSADGALVDRVSGTRWERRGHHLHGPLRQDLERVASSDEYWFSWKRFHPETRLVRLDGAADQAASSSPYTKVARVL